MAERLVIVFAIWAIGIAYVVIRRRYSAMNLLLVSVGSALTLVAYAAVPDYGFELALAALGATLLTTGYEWEQRRRQGGESTPRIRPSADRPGGARSPGS